MFVADMELIVDMAFFLLSKRCVGAFQRCVKIIQKGCFDGLQCRIFRTK